MPLVMIKSDPRAREKPCLRCGYSLRRLGDATHCPECGLSVWVSLNQNDSLEWSRPEWLRRMAVGLWLMAGACLVGLVGYVPAGIQSARMMDYLSQVQTEAQRAAMGDPSASFVPSSPPPSLAPAIERGVAAAGWGYLGLYFGGLVLATTNERRYPDRLAGWRLGARISAGAAALVLAFAMFWSMTSWRWTSGGLAFRIVAIAGALLIWGYLRHIARRMMNGKMAKLCGWLMLLPALSLLKVFPFFGAYLFFWFHEWFEFLPLIYLPASAVLLAWFAIRTRRAAVSAEQQWAAETAVTR